MVKRKTSVVNTVKNFVGKYLVRNKSDIGPVSEQTAQALQEIASDDLTEPERRIFKNFTQFYYKTVDDVMVPRSDISAVPSNIKSKDLIENIVESMHTRTLIYDDNVDNIVGFVHIKDIFEIIAKGHVVKIKKIMRKPIVVAPSVMLVDLLSQMQEKRIHIAVVIDEYGCTDGIVTIEDIIESILDRIEDEHDDLVDENYDYKIDNNGDIVASARVKIEEIERVLERQLRNEDDDCETIGGLVLARAGHIPNTGIVVAINDEVQIEVLESTSRGVVKVKVILDNESIEN